MSRRKLRAELAVPLAAVMLAGIAPVPAGASAAAPRMLGVNPKTDAVRIVERPGDLLTDSGDGGLLRLHWTRWTSTVAKGYGRAYPDHGSYPITVTASRVRNGVFTRMIIYAHDSGRSRADHMATALLGGQLTWMELSWMNNPDSGATPWNGSE